MRFTTCHVALAVALGAFSVYSTPIPQIPPPGFLDGLKKGIVKSFAEKLVAPALGIPISTGPSPTSVPSESSFTKPLKKMVGALQKIGSFELGLFHW